jgi:hypothetical protein
MYLVERKRMSKWYMKLFKRLLNCTMLNSVILFRQVRGQNIDHLSYRVQLVEGLFYKYAQDRSGAGGRASDNTLPRLRDKHFIRKVAPKSEKYRPQRRCIVCTNHGRKKMSVYCCEECDVGLCMEDCFEAYHTKLNY